MKLFKPHRPSNTLQWTFTVNTSVQDFMGNLSLVIQVIT